MRCSRRKWMIFQLFRIFFTSILCILIIVSLITFFYTIFPMMSSRDRKTVHVIGISGSDKGPSFQKKHRLFLIPLSDAPERHIKVFNNGTQHTSTTPMSAVAAGRKCGHHSCFNIYRCGRVGQDHLSVFVYPIERIFVNGKLLQEVISKEFYQILDTILRSPYYVSDPEEACIFIPTIDLLNLGPFLRNDSTVSMTDVLRALQGLD